MPPGVSLVLKPINNGLICKLFYSYLFICVDRESFACCRTYIAVVLLLVIICARSIKVYRVFYKSLSCLRFRCYKLTLIGFYYTVRCGRLLCLQPTNSALCL